MKHLITEAHYRPQYSQLNLVTCIPNPDGGFRQFFVTGAFDSIKAAQDFVKALGLDVAVVTKH